VGAELLPGLARVASAWGDEQSTTEDAEDTEGDPHFSQKTREMGHPACSLVFVYCCSTLRLEFEDGAAVAGKTAPARGYAEESTLPVGNNVPWGRASASTLELIDCLLGPGCAAGIGSKLEKSAAAADVFKAVSA